MNCIVIVLTIHWSSLYYVYYCSLILRICWDFSNSPGFACPDPRINLFYWAGLYI